jgi:hypothetical protein
MDNKTEALILLAEVLVLLGGGIAIYAVSLTRKVRTAEQQAAVFKAQRDVARGQLPSATPADVTAARNATQQLANMSEHGVNTAL